MLTIKQTLKSFGIIIICFSLFFLETLFLSYQLDITDLDTSLFNPMQQCFYDAQISMCNMMNVISFGIIGVFSIILLFFSIERYIEENKANMGVLKALGYSKNRIALSFIKFSIPSTLGSLLGYLGGVASSKLFYSTMNADNIIENFSFTFRPSLLLIFIFAPLIIVSIFAYIIALIKLRGNALDMINQTYKNKKIKTTKEKDSFLKEVKTTMLRNHISLIIFVAFSGLCFSANIQMAFTMLFEAETSPLFFWMIFGIGLLLGFTIIVLSFKFVYTNNRKYMGMLKAYGYTDKECYLALYGGYHIVSLLSFVLGTFYQVLIMSISFKQFEGTYGIKYSFNLPSFFISIGLFIAIYISVNIYSYILIRKLKLDSLNSDLA